MKRIKSDTPTEQKPVKNKGGRPKEDLADKVDFHQVEVLAGLGLTDVEVGQVLGVCEDTVTNWKEDPRFVRALKDGKVVTDSKVIQSLYRRALGYKVIEKTFEAVKDAYGRSTKAVRVKTVVKQVGPDTTACLAWLNNRRPQDWRNNREAALPPVTPEEEKKQDHLIAEAEAQAEQGSATCH